ncbi:MAG: hypothetical protein QM679_05775 [Patulibacter sp.]
MTKRESPAGLTLDTGALLALERGDEYMRALLESAVGNDLAITVPAGVVAQAWRGGPRQARIARLLGDQKTQVIALDDVTARAVGLLCGRSGHHDVVDVHVALHARDRSYAVVTSDPDDLTRIDPQLRIITV